MMVDPEFSQPFWSPRCASFSSPGWCAKARFRQQSNRKRRSQTSSPWVFFGDEILCRSKKIGSKYLIIQPMMIWIDILDQK